MTTRPFPCARCGGTAEHTPTTFDAERRPTWWTPEQTIGGARDALHAHADATGRTIGDIAADIIERHAGDPVRRVVAVVEAMGEGWSAPTSSKLFDAAVLALEWCLLSHPGARIEDAGPRRYEVVL